MRSSSFARWPSLELNGASALLLEIKFYVACLGVYEVGASNLPYESEAVVRSASSKELLRNITFVRKFFAQILLDFHRLAHGASCATIDSFGNGICASWC